MVASAIRVVFEQPDEAAARDQCTRVIAMFEPRMPAVARLLADAEPDLLAHFTFPELHRSRIRSTNPQGAAQQGDPSVGMVQAGRAATAARTVGDRAEA
jgi:transposase-like protein